jgi:hypothetical protein
MAITNYEQIARQVLMTGDVTEDSSGRLSIDGISSQSKLSEAIAEAIYVGEIFRNGQSVTSKYTVNAKVGDAVRVPLRTPFPSSSRTLSLGGRTGTDGNGGIINMNEPMMPANEEFIVFLNQVNDQDIVFADMAMEMMPINKTAEIIASYSQSVVEDRSASILAEILSYSIYRSLNGASCINTINTATAGAYGTLLNNLNTALDNGDLITGAHTYPTQGRCIIARPSFVNGMFNRDSGVILTGSDLAQTMLKEYNFKANIADRDYVGNAYRGNVMQFDIQCAANYIWTLAEKYLGLTAGALDNVLGVAVSFDTTAVSENIDLGVKMIDSQKPRGLRAQPLNCWGHEGFRLNQLIGTTSLKNDIFTAAGFTAAVRKYPIAPKDVFTTANTNQIQVPIYDATGNIVGYRAIANIPKPNSGNIKNSTTFVTLTLLDADEEAVEEATVTVANGQMSPTVTEVGDGVYTFAIGQNTAATVTIKKTGYADATVSITKANAAGTTYSTTKTLAASAG